MNDKEMTSAEDVVRLGGSIELSGFREVDGSSMVILRKIIGNYTRKLSDRLPGFEGISVRMKSPEGKNLFEISAKLHDTGRVKASSVTEKNLFVAVDTALKKLDREL